MAREKQSRRRLAQLVRRAQQGDGEAFAEIYRLTGQAQFYLMAHKVGYEAAADLLQELYLIAWRNIENIQPYALLGYLGATGRNLCKRHLDSARRTSENLSLDQGEDDGEWLVTESSQALRDEAADPAAKVIGDDEQTRLAQALQELTDIERDALILRYYQHLKIDEIAEALNTSRNTVKRAINRALESLRRKMGLLPFGLGLSGLLDGAVSNAAGHMPTSAALTENGAPWAGSSSGTETAARETSAGEATSVDRSSRAATRVIAVATAVLVIGALGFVATAPRNEAAEPEAVPEEEPAPLAEPPAEQTPHDTQAPELLDVHVEGELTVLTFANSKDIADVWCIGADGTTYRPISSDDKWSFQLPSGTYEAHALDTAGNESAGTITCDIVPENPEPATKSLS